MTDPVRATADVSGSTNGAVAGSPPPVPGALDVGPRGLGAEPEPSPQEKQAMLHLSNGLYYDLKGQYGIALTPVVS